jgi:hypothetical protein
VIASPGSLLDEQSDGISRRNLIFDCSITAMIVEPFRLRDCLLYPLPQQAALIRELQWVHRRIAQRHDE